MPFKSYYLEVGLRGDGYENNFTPFATISKLFTYSRHAVTKQIGGNILLGMPLGFLLPFVWPKKSFIKIFVIGFLFSMAIEASQYIVSNYLGFNYRITDIDDIILNTFGCILGYLVYIMLRLMFHHEKKDPSGL